MEKNFQQIYGMNIIIWDSVKKKNQQYYIGFNDDQIPGFGLSSTNLMIFNLFVLILLFSSYSKDSTWSHQLWEVLCGFTRLFTVVVLETTP